MCSEAKHELKNIKLFNYFGIICGKIKARLAAIMNHSFPVLLQNKRSDSFHEALSMVQLVQ